MPQGLDLQSEEFGPLGNAVGETLQRTIGRPSLDILVLMIREAVQNSWDARSPEGQVTFGIESRSLSPAERRALAQTFEHVPVKGLPLADVLQRERIDVTVITDRGTRGLGGPTRADDLSQPQTGSFVRFFRNIGRNMDAGAGGGTYGLGRGGLFKASEAHTIVVHTRWRNARGALDHRLMAMAVGSEYTHSRGGRRSRHTGRHWWGVLGADGIVDPLEGARAAALALKLGMSGFGEAETGTGIMIIQPELGEAETFEAAHGNMCEAVLRYAWPHCIQIGDAPAPLQLTSSFQGTPRPFPSPEQHPWIAPFVAPFREASGLPVAPDIISGLSGWDVRCERPQRLLGRLALQRVMGGEAGRWTAADCSERLFPAGSPRHVALMRSPRLVVRYAEIPSPAGAGVAGVFVADDSLNDVFASAEPVTHDDWTPESLAVRTDRTLVRVALTRVRELASAFAAPAGIPAADTAPTPLGAISAFLAELIAEAEGSGAELPDSPGGSGSGSGGGGGGGGGGRPGRLRRRPRIEVLETRLAVVAGRPVSLTRFRLVATPGDTLPEKVTVGASVRVVLAGGRLEDNGDAPAGAQQPEVLGWEGPGISERRAGAESHATVAPAPSAEWTVIASVLPGTLTDVVLEVTA